MSYDIAKFQREQKVHPDPTRVEDNLRKPVLWNRGLHIDTKGHQLEDIDREGKVRSFGGIQAESAGQEA
jgi:hypothetical protein